MRALSRLLCILWIAQHFTQAVQANECSSAGQIVSQIVNPAPPSSPFRLTPRQLEIVKKFEKTLSQRPASYRKSLLARLIQVPGGQKFLQDLPVDFDLWPPEIQGELLYQLQHLKRTHQLMAEIPGDKNIFLRRLILGIELNDQYPSQAVNETFYRFALLRDENPAKWGVYVSPRFVEKYTRWRKVEMAHFSPKKAGGVLDPNPVSRFKKLFVRHGKYPTSFNNDSIVKEWLEGLPEEIEAHPLELTPEEKKWIYKHNLKERLQRELPGPENAPLRNLIVNLSADGKGPVKESFHSAYRHAMSLDRDPDKWGIHLPKNFKERYVAWRAEQESLSLDQAKNEKAEAIAKIKKLRDLVSRSENVPPKVRQHAAIKEWLEGLPEEIDELPVDLTAAEKKWIFETKLDQRLKAEIPGPENAFFRKLIFEVSAYDKFPTKYPNPSYYQFALSLRGDPDQWGVRLPRNFKERYLNWRETKRESKGTDLALPSKNQLEPLDQFRKLFKEKKTAPSHLKSYPEVAHWLDSLPENFEELPHHLSVEEKTWIYARKIKQRLEIEAPGEQNALLRRLIFRLSVSDQDLHRAADWALHKFAMRQDEDPKKWGVTLPPHFEERYRQLRAKEKSRTTSNRPVWNRSVRTGLKEKVPDPLERFKILYKQRKTPTSHLQNDPQVVQWINDLPEDLESLPPQLTLEEKTWIYERKLRQRLSAEIPGEQDQHLRRLLLEMSVYEKEPSRTITPDYYKAVMILDPNPDRWGVKLPKHFKERFLPWRAGQIERAHRELRFWRTMPPEIQRTIPEPPN